MCKYFCIFVPDLILQAMKNRFFLFAMLLSALPLVAQVHITMDDPDTWSAEVLRPYIGQTVIFDMPMIVCTNVNSNYTVSPWRRFQPESHGFKGSAEYNETVRINNSCMFSISGISGYHRCGEKIYNLKAKVNSLTSLTWLGGTWHGNTRAELNAGLPDLGDYRLLVCGFNLENYYMTLNSMGAKTASDRTRQQKKIQQALEHINADIFGLVELQQGDTAVKVLVKKLNDAQLVAPGDNTPRNYKYFHDAAVGTYQKVEFVYDANKVAPIGTPVETNVEVQNRKKMLCFRELATGEKFIYSINHFKAMNTGGAERRENEAKAVMKLYNSYRQNHSIRESDLLVMGDLNCYAYTEPIAVFVEDNDMLNLHYEFHADSSYSYMYGNMASYIDHAICSTTLFEQITGMSAYHINSDEDDQYTYDKSTDETMFRCSDHDPVLVGLKLDSTLVYDPAPIINTADIFRGDADKLLIKNAHKSGGQRSFYAIYTVSGLLQDKKEITSALFEVDLPQAPGVYIVYVYHDGVAYQRRIIVR